MKTRAVSFGKVRHQRWHGDPSNDFPILFNLYEYEYLVRLKLLSATSSKALLDDPPTADTFLLAKTFTWLNEILMKIQKNPRHLRET